MMTNLVIIEEKPEREQLVLRGSPNDVRWFQERAKAERRSYGELLAVIRMELEKLQLIQQSQGGM